MILCTTDESRTPQLFQSGYLGDPPPAGGAPGVRVRIVEWPALGVPRPSETVDHGDAATDLDLTIAAVVAASDRLGLPAPFRPLLPPLPAELPLADLPGRVTAEPTAAAVPFGLLDDPAAQAQPAAVLNLAGTDRLLVAGGPQSGRTTVARTLITSVAGRMGPDQAHLYVIENRPAGLSGYASLPHCGAVLSAAEPDRIRRLVTWLDGEVQRRTVAHFTATGEPDPWIILIIDGWEYFENRGDPNFMETSLLGTMRAIITAGPPVGVHVVAIGGQDMMSGKVPGLYSHRILLPFPKEEIRKQSLSGPMVPPPVLPGRAIDAGTGLHLQVCRPPGTPADLTGPVRDPLPAHRLPRRFPAMPTTTTLADLAVPGSVPSATWIPLGVGGPDVATLGVDLFDAGPHLMLVSGPGGAGRSTAAATVAHGLRRIDVGVLAIAPSRSPLRTLLPDDAGVRVLTGTTFKDADLRDAVEAFGDGPYAVIIDDCEQITVTPTQEGFSEAPTLLQDITDPGALGRRSLIMCGDAMPVLEGQRRSLMRIVNEIMTAGTRVLLTPTSVPVARTHGFTLDRDQFFAGPPGRGYLTAGRGAQSIHLATP
jgi:S-DNA-T family DNA segregation ATPase FtsK/SpoIIIE